MDEHIRWTASQCRHYAMCKIDYLGTGLCPAGTAKHYVAYYPQGRMDLADALARGIIPVTEGLLEIADSCDLCGACEVQCHFYTGLRPLGVMAALKDAVRDHVRSGQAIARPPQDSLVEDLRAIVGAEWASNDPAILVTYANDPFPLTEMRMPRAVVLPGSTEQVEEIVRRAARGGIPFAVRGNGGSVYGQVFSAGLVLDMVRMREISFDIGNWSVTIGPGVTSFELQRQASLRGFRVNVAEPAATVIGNIICTGLFSTWSTAYGMGADHILDMEFVDREGRRFRLSDSEGLGTKLLAYRHRVQEIPGVCTRAVVRLQPVTGDEEGMIVPFDAIEPALRFARDLAVRRIGLAVAVLGPHYMAAFLSPDLNLFKKVKQVLPDDLGIGFGVYVVADKCGRESVHRLAGRNAIDQALYRKIVLGLPRLVEGEALDLLRAAEGSRAPYEILTAPETQPLLEAVLDPAPETLASSVDEDLRSDYADLYRQARFTDLVWVNAFRIVSARMGRHKHIIAFILFIPLDETLVTQLCDRFGDVAREIGLDHDYGFLTPIDMGKRAVLEYDYYIDHTDPSEKEKAGRAMGALIPWLDDMCAGPESNMTWLKTVFTQGSARKESWFYRDLAGRPDVA
ncbi:MAG: iron-sulfur cluster-binding FAD-binding oxidoreductase [Acidobacteria bacterium]|nr:iron-sulfur cluster-binding FAD-binding oxidoreductase [Acidobacteriota bacterium]